MRLSQFTALATGTVGQGPELGSAGCGDGEEETDGLGPHLPAARREGDPE